MEEIWEEVKNNFLKKKAGCLIIVKQNFSFV